MKTLISTLPLSLLTAGALSICPALPPWGKLWILATAIFAGFKWLTFGRALAVLDRPSAGRMIAYLFLWPGMDAKTFLDPRRVATRTTFGQWILAIIKTVFGAGLVWGVVRLFPSPLAAGWVGMVGLIVLLHFGIFDGLALFWRSRGIAVQPLMRCPIASKTVAELWGRRWNVAFQNIAFELFFIPAKRWVGASAALVVTFLISGVIHDVVISIPAGGGYGLPTMYFTIQGIAILVERRLGIPAVAGGILRRGFTLAVAILPAGILFSPLFVERVMLPFLTLIGALPAR